MPKPSNKPAPTPYLSIDVSNRPPPAVINLPMSQFISLLDKETGIVIKFCNCHLFLDNAAMKSMVVEKANVLIIKAVDTPSSIKVFISIYADNRRITRFDGLIRIGIKYDPKEHGLTNPTVYRTLKDGAKKSLITVYDKKTQRLVYVLDRLV